jgi:hypothetical protein
MAWFTKKRPPEHEDLGPMVPGTVYAQVWERKRLPDEGAQSYAYETLDLPQFTYIGPTISVRSPDPVPILNPPMYAYQAGMVIGMPLTAGQYYTTPLVDQNGNQVVTGFPNSDIMSQYELVAQPNEIFWNQPFPAAHADQINHFQ